MSHVLVAAFDFGTTFSTCAISYWHTYKRNPTNITISAWGKDSEGFPSWKTPACILFDPTGKFHSFGYDAEEMYSNLALDDKHHDWFYYRRFTMMLTNKMDLTRDTLIEDVKGKKMEAMKVFSSAIDHHKDHLLTLCKKQLLENFEITWVLTVPAIWNDKLKQFIRECAEKVGIRRDRLKLAIEPEAALLYCMHLPEDEYRKNATYEVITTGDKYMVVVAGDEKVDISVHEVMKNGSVKTLSILSGCDCGETELEASFIGLLTDIVGKDVMDSFSSTQKYDLSGLLRDFEVKKKTVSPERNEKVTFTVPASLLEIYFEKNPGREYTGIKYKDQIIWKRDKLRMNAHLVKSLFDRSCKQIVDHLKELFMHPTVKDVSSILLVGGFAESPMLQTAIRDAFKSKYVIIPNEASLAVIKGATLCGHEPKRTSGTVKSIFLVAAIDFGTTFSGYAFSFRHEYMNDPLKISTTNWNAGSGGLVSLKTSTCVLFDPTGKFDSFGYDAEEKYSNLALDNKHHDWFYFCRFKMMLYNKKDLTRETLIEDDKGKKMKAIKVFSSAIGYIKDQLLNHCKKQTTGIDEYDVEWVLTVPAIWNDNSKQFMREAAEKACICGDSLVFALEPEAASLFCMHLPVQKDSVNSTYEVFKSGEKYMVVDAGGGTIDITVHQVKDNGSVKELHKASGGDWGGTRVDAFFTSLLADIVGKDVMETFSSIHKYDFLHMLRDFEVKKRTIGPGLNNVVTFTVPISLPGTFSEKNPGCNITDAASKSKYSNHLTWASDKLRIEANLTKSLFDRSCKQIVDHLKELFMHPAVKDVSSILLVGGFAESPMLQTAIKEAFKSKHVIIPEEAGLAVLKGAVICGHAPETISGRICRYTYGVKTTTKFDSTIHPKVKKTVLNGIEYCDDIFSIHVRVGQIVEVGEPQVKQTYYVTEPDQTSIRFKIYNSNNREPKYTTDEGCTYLGKLTIEMPDTSKGLDRGVIVHMTFSGTEIAVTAVDKDHPEKAASTKVDFLG